MYTTFNLTLFYGVVRPASIALLLTTMLNKYFLFIAQFQEKLEVTDTKTNRYFAYCSSYHKVISANTKIYSRFLLPLSTSYIKYFNQFLRYFHQNLLCTETRFLNRNPRYSMLTILFPILSFLCLTVEICTVCCNIISVCRVAR